MNRIDNNHATFLNCLRDWNDPYLHGNREQLHQSKSITCQRCESCACRGANTNASSVNTTVLNNNNDDQLLNSSSQSSINNSSCHQPHPQRKYTGKRRSSNEITCELHNGSQAHRNSKCDPFQPLVRCKSSVNVPKTIDQCIKLAKSRPRPSSIRPYASTKSTTLTNDATVGKTNSNGTLFLSIYLESFIFLAIWIFENKNFFFSSRTSNLIFLNSKTG